MAKKIVAKIISRGLQDIMTQRLKSDFSAYEGDPVVWQGETALTFTPAQEVTELPSGNDPAWDAIPGLVTGDVKLTIYEIPLDVMSELLAVKYSEADGVCVGDSADGVVWLGLSFDRLIRKNGVDSRNKAILHKVRFDLPAINVKTIEKGDNAVANVELTGHAYPLFFKKKDGSMASRTYCIVNSMTNKTKYDANAESIVFPTEFTEDSSGS